VEPVELELEPVELELEPVEPVELMHKEPFVLWYKRLFVYME